MINIDDKNRIKALYKKGITLREISKLVGHSQTSILSIIKSMDIPMRVNSGTPASKKEKVVELYNKGDSILSIIKKTGVKSEQTIYVILREYNVPRRRNT